MADDVSAPTAWLAKVGGRQGVIDDQWNTCLMGYGRHPLQIDHDPAGIGEVLKKDRLGARGQRLAEILRVGRVDKMALPAELFERQPKLRQRAAIEVARGNELVSCLHQRKEDQELCGMPRGGGNGGAATFEAGDPLLQDGHSRVVQTRIDVAEIM